MKFLVLYAHPARDSFHSSIHHCVVAALTKAGHAVDDCDLYAEKFEPLLSADERRTYHEIPSNVLAVADHVERLRSAQGVLFVYPTWWYGMPAILKGYFDRVWVPGVAFSVIDGRTKPLLHHIVRYGAVTTYGSPWWLNKLVFRDPNKRVIMRCIRHLVAPNASTVWLAQYGLDFNDRARREAFLDRISRRLERF